jgi:hypothetical protein
MWAQAAGGAPSPLQATTASLPRPPPPPPLPVANSSPAARPFTGDGAPLLFRTSAPVGGACLTRDGGGGRRLPRDGADGARLPQDGSVELVVDPNRGRDCRAPRRRLSSPQW